MNGINFKKHLKIVIICVFALTVLAISFFCGAPSSDNVQKNPDMPQSTVLDKSKENPEKTKEEISQEEIDSLKDSDTEKNSVLKNDNDKKNQSAQNVKTNNADSSDKNSGKDAQNGKNAQKSGQDGKNTGSNAAQNGVKSSDITKNDNKEKTCTISIRCDTILKNMSSLAPEKQAIIPKNGVVISETKADFHEGETVFNVLLRETKKHKIHFEFSKTPVYQSAYIEGIANIYEYDAGELSGWMYKVNGVFPNMGCSRYVLSDGDKIEWVYTCDLGKDVGGYFKSGGGQKDE